MRLNLEISMGGLGRGVRNFGVRSWHAVAAAVLILFNRYEGGQRWGTGRSHVPSEPPQDARFDANAETRLEIVRKARYFERNNALVNRLADLFEQFTVGAGGLQFVPSSSDEEWNQNAQAWWDEWCRVCDLTSLQSFGTIQSLVARSWFIDGEIFLLKTQGKELKPAAGEPLRRPRLQLIEAHRVETPSAMAAQEGRTIIDGIEIDAVGRPVAYWVRNQNLTTIFDVAQSDAKYRRVPAEEIIHVFEPSRPGQYRGLPFLYPVINDLHDLDDLQMLEMGAAKEAAATSNVIMNAAGEIDPAQARRERLSQTTQKSDGTEVTEYRLKQIKQVLGSRTIALKTGEKMEQFRSERPSVAVREYWDYLTSKICAGTGITKMLVFPWSIQGTVARADLDVANAYFRSRSSVLICAFTAIYEWAIDWAKNNDRRLADPPADYKSVDALAPRAVNVDVGRNSSAMLAELESGATTYKTIYGPLGTNWRKELWQRFTEEAYILKLSKLPQFEGVTPAHIRASVAAHMERMAEEDERRRKEDELEVAA
jgi:lambda family phage portal protein